MNIYFASVPKEKLLVFEVKGDDYPCIRIPESTILMKDFPFKRPGYKRISIDLDNISGYNILNHIYPTSTNSFITENESIFWPISYKTNDKSGIVIIDRIRLHPDLQGFLNDWMPLQNVSLFSNPDAYIKGIQDLSFKGHKIIEKVKFEDDLEYLGCDSFSDCPNLKTVIFGINSLKSFPENRCFNNCPELSEIVIPYKVNFNETWFINCPNLHYATIKDTSIKIPIQELGINK